MPILQDLIHKVEVGGGIRYVKYGIPILAVVGIILGFNIRNFKNMSNAEAMDSAQLARNISQGKGFTTLYVRPFSMYLLRQKNQLKPESLSADKRGDLSQIKGQHPDLANPPAYPLMLAGFMKILPFKYAVDNTHPFWSEMKPPPQSGRLFQRYEPDFLISVINQLIFFGIVVMFYFLARRLFEPRVAGLSAALLFCTEVFWRFSVSGLSTILLLFFFLAMVWCLVLVEAQGRELVANTAKYLGMALLAGVLVGLGCMTRYGYGFAIVPVLLYLIIFGGPQRIAVTALAFVGFAVVITPWIIRNYSLCGAPFGTASYTLLQSTLYAEHRLDQFLEPDMSNSVFTLNFFKQCLQTMIVNLRPMFTVDFPKLGGGWISALFFVGLLVGFRDPALQRLRYFLVGCLVVLSIVQALGKTPLTEDSPGINSENLLVLLAPLVLVYGVSLFFMFLDQFDLHIRELRYAAVGAFGLIICWPMVFAFLPPKSGPISYPPYYPPSIQVATDWVKENELMMSDMPWAVAWYGQRQCVWLTADPSDLMTINDYQKPIETLYLTRITIDSRLYSRFMMTIYDGWGTLLFQCQQFFDPDPMRWPRKVSLPFGSVVTGERLIFPLHYWQLGEDRFKEQMLLTGRDKPVNAP